MQPSNLLATKYRPKTLNEFFLIKPNTGDTSNTLGVGSSTSELKQPLQKEIIQTLLDIDDLNILFIGNTSVGKTSLLYILIREYYHLDKDSPFPENNILFINNLKEQGISFFRGEMKTFCQASSTIYGKKKMVIIDDIDFISEQNQQVFRNYIDKYKHNIHFVSVCTNIQKVIEPFQSRMHILTLEPHSKEILMGLCHRVIINEGIQIDDESLQFIYKYCLNSLRNLLNHLEKICILNRQITIDVCMSLCTDISFQQFEQYFECLRALQLSNAIHILYKIYDYGYSVVDIYDYLFTFVKGTNCLQEEEKYKIIQLLCKYITIFHTIHEEPIELAIFTNKCLLLLRMREVGKMCEDSSCTQTWSETSDVLSRVVETQTPEVNIDDVAPEDDASRFRTFQHESFRNGSHVTDEYSSEVIRMDAGGGVQEGSSRTHETVINQQISECNNKEPSLSSSPTSHFRQISQKYVHEKIFKEKVPLSILFTLLESICTKKHKYYIFDENAFRSLQYNKQLYESFIKTVLPCYHSSKKFYATRKHETISSFMTVVNQICKQHDIEITHKIFYRDNVKQHEFRIPW